MTDTSNLNENIEMGAPSKAAFSRFVTTLGEREGMGSNSRPGLFVHFVDGARNGLLDVDDVADYYSKYARAVAAKQNIGYVPQSSEKQQVSKFAVAVKLGQLPQVNGVEVINTAIEVQKEQRAANEGKLPMSPLDGLVAVGRAQLAFPDVMLTRDQINAVMTPAAKDDPLEADRLDKIASAIEKMRTNDKVSEDTKAILDTIIDPLVQRVKQLGGTAADRARAERERKKIAKTQAQLATLMRGNGVPMMSLVAAE